MIDGVEVVRHPRARVARLSVDPATGRVRLTVPKRMALAKAVAWAGQKTDWIATQRAKLPQGRPFVDGAVLPVAGRDVRLMWSEAASRIPTLRPCGEGRDDEAVVVCGGPAEAFATRINCLRESAGTRVRLTAIVLALH